MWGIETRDVVRVVTRDIISKVGEIWKAAKKSYHQAVVKRTAKY